LSGEPGLAQRLAMPGMAFANLADAGQDLMPAAAEVALVATAGEKRRRDFFLGRHCAHLALERLGHPVAVLEIGARGAPAWPPGVTGSITHTKGYAAAIAAPVTVFAALGLDTERIGEISRELGKKLFRPEEQESLAGLGDDEWSRAATIIFSAKEAYYKACLGARDALRFHSLCVRLEADGFSVTEDAGRQAAGRFLVSGGLVLTLVAVPA
jgi:4'-phosphopantetheinyl transferase EntD